MLADKFLLKTFGIRSVKTVEQNQIMNGWLAMNVCQCFELVNWFLEDVTHSRTGGGSALSLQMKTYCLLLTA